jgi:hypothetical protein
MTDYSIVRDYYDRPLVTTDGGPLRYEAGRKTPVNAEPYTRISTLSGALDDKGGLVDWSAARAMIGLAKSDSIHAQVAHLVSAYSDPWAVPSAKKPLKDLVRKAQELGGSDDAAGLGTAFHGLTEVLDGGDAPSFIPRQLADWLRAYAEAMSNWEPVHIEPFVVCDELKTAGSPDRYLRNRTTGEVFAADIKSGTSEPDFPMKVTIQVAIAAHAELYNQETGERTPIECSQERGVLIHAPIRGGGVPRVDVYDNLDLVEGWRLAKLAVQVREARKFPKLKRI